MNGAPKPPSTADGFDPPESADEPEREDASAPLELALEELEFVSVPKSLRILGVYPAHRFRETFK